jgi:hypothetical protein
VIYWFGQGYQILHIPQSSSRCIQVFVVTIYPLGSPVEIRGSLPWVRKGHFPCHSQYTYFSLFRHYSAELVGAHGTASRHLILLLLLLLRCPNIACLCLTRRCFPHLIPSCQPPSSPRATRHSPTIIPPLYMPPQYQLILAIPETPAGKRIGTSCIAGSSSFVFTPPLPV